MAADLVLREAMLAVRRVLGAETAMLLPATTTAAPAAPPVHQQQAPRGVTPATTPHLSCVAGLPAVVVPASVVGEAPVELCLIGPPRSDPRTARPRGVDRATHRTSRPARAG